MIMTNATLYKDMHRAAFQTAVRRPIANRSARVITLASGSNRVGKTSIAVNLSLALARLGKRAMLVDCDLPMGSVSGMMGIDTSENLGDVMNGRLSVDEITIDGPDALFIVPGANGEDPHARLDLATRSRLADAFRPHRNSLDYVIVDTPAGIEPDTMDMVAASDMAVLVLTPDRDAFMDAYAVLKSLSLENGVEELAIVTNLIDDEAAGRELFRRFRDVASRFLTTRLSYLGGIARDHRMQASVLRRRCIIEQYPHARATRALNELATTVDTRSIRTGEGGDAFFGMEALLGAH